MNKKDPVILSLRDIGRKYNRHPNTIINTWKRAKLPFYPCEVVDCRGRRRVVRGIDKAMFEAFLMEGGLPRRMPSIAIGRIIKKRFGIED